MLPRLPCLHVSPVFAGFPLLPSPFNLKSVRTARKDVRCQRRSGVRRADPERTHEHGPEARAVQVKDMKQRQGSSINGKVFLARFAFRTNFQKEAQSHYLDNWMLNVEVSCMPTVSRYLPSICKHDHRSAVRRNKTSVPKASFVWEHRGVTYFMWRLTPKFRVLHPTNPRVEQWTHSG